MNKYLEYEELADHVVVRYTGPHQFPELSDMAREIGETCVARGWFRVLVDIRGSVGYISVPDRYKVVNEMASFWDRRVKMALLGRLDQRLSDRPWELMAGERGLISRDFMDGKLALEWLLKN